MQASPVLSLSPSFTSYSSRRLTDIAARVVEELREESESNDDFFYCYTEEEIPVPSLHNSNAEPEKQEQEQPKIEENNSREEVDEEEEDDDDESEFSFVCREPNTSPISADEIFYNGQIRPIFPIFNRDLLLGGDDGLNNDDVSKPRTTHRLSLGKLMTEERDPPSCSSSEADELDGVPSGTYCVWTPKSVDPSSPGRCKKSNSTGSSKRWKFRDLLHRSNSDGKDTFVFLTPSSSPKAKKKEEKVEKEVSADIGKVSAGGKVRADRIVATDVGESVPSAHEVHYVRNRAMKEGDRRRSYLPYRQDLVGFFANVNGLSRNLHPF